MIRLVQAPYDRILLLRGKPKRLAPRQAKYLAHALDHPRGAEAVAVFFGRFADVCERRTQPFHFSHQHGHIFECSADYQVVVDLWPGPTAVYRVKRSLRTGPDGGKFFGRHTFILAAGSAA